MDKTREKMSPSSKSNIFGINNNEPKDSLNKVEMGMYTISSKAFPGLPGLQFS